MGRKEDDRQQGDGEKQGGRQKEDIVRAQAWFHVSIVWKCHTDNPVPVNLGIVEVFRSRRQRHSNRSCNRIPQRTCNLRTVGVIFKVKFLDAVEKDIAGSVKHRCPQVFGKQSCHISVIVCLSENSSIRCKIVFYILSLSLCVDTDLKHNENEGKHGKRRRKADNQLAAVNPPDGACSPVFRHSSG